MLKLFWLAVLALFVYAFWYIYLRPETYELTSNKERMEEYRESLQESLPPPAPLEGKDVKG